MDFLLDKLFTFSNTFFTILFFVVLYLIVNFILTRQSKGQTEGKLIRQMVLFLITMVGLISVILALPFDGETRGQISSLLGILISGVLAFSSTTFIGNMLAGILLRFINHYKSGDFVLVNEYFGRVTERGLFHTELQTIDRNLITLPNMLLATNPVKVTRSSGTFIKAECSLGYDVPRTKVEKCLMEAAKKSGLKDPFMHITSLGDFSIVYTIHGLLTDVKRVITAKSNLHAMMLDELHDAGIEIVSPSFMNQRPTGDTIFIPKKDYTKVVETKNNLEDLIFDKAEQAEGIEVRKERLKEVETKIKELQAYLKDCMEEEKETVGNNIAKYESIRDRLNKNIVEKQGDLENEK